MTVKAMVAQAIKGNGVPVVIRPNTNSAVETRGIFEAESVENGAGEGTAIRPAYSVTIPAEDAVRVKAGTQISVNSKLYRVADVLGDGLLVHRLTLGANSRSY